MSCSTDARTGSLSLCVLWLSFRSGGLLFLLLLQVGQNRFTLVLHLILGRNPVVLQQGLQDLNALRVVVLLKEIGDLIDLALEHGLLHLLLLDTLRIVARDELRLDGLNLRFQKTECIRVGDVKSVAHVCRELLIWFAHLV